MNFVRAAQQAMLDRIASSLEWLSGRGNIPAEFKPVVMDQLIRRTEVSSSTYNAIVIQRFAAWSEPNGDIRQASLKQLAEDIKVLAGLKIGDIWRDHGKKIEAAETPEWQTKRRT